MATSKEIGTAKRLMLAVVMLCAIFAWTYPTDVFAATLVINPATRTFNIEVGKPFSADFTAVSLGFPITWDAIPGGPPSWATWVATPGDPKARITGTPTSANEWSFPIHCTDTAGNASNTEIVKIVATDPPYVDPSIVTTQSDLPVQLIINQKIVPDIVFVGKDGKPTYAWSVTGNLPQGTIFDNFTGKLTGTPSKTGTYAFTVTYTDSIPKSAQKSFTLTVVTEDQAIFEINTADPLPEGYVNIKYELQFQATVTGSVIWSVEGSLPAGLTLNSGGFLFGVPTLAGDYPITIKATNPSNGSFVSKTFTLHIANSSGFIITTNTGLPDAKLNDIYSLQLEATGGNMPYTFTMTSGSLPKNLSMISSGLITGTATELGSFSFTVRATDSTVGGSQNQEKTFTLRVTLEGDTGGGGDDGDEPTITFASNYLPTAVLDKPYSAKINPVGGTSPYYLVIESGRLPQGLTMDLQGNISGVPSEFGSQQFTIKVVDSGDPQLTAVKSFVIKVIDEGKLDLTSLPDAYVGSDYTGLEGEPVSIAVSGGKPPYRYELVAGQLPDGTQIFQRATDNTAQIQGIPTKDGIYRFSIKVTDKMENTSLQEFTIKVLRRAPDFPVIQTMRFPLMRQVAGGWISYLLAVNTSPTLSFGKITIYDPSGFVIIDEWKFSVPRDSKLILPLYDETFRANLPSSFSIKIDSGDYNLFFQGAMVDISGRNPGDFIMLDPIPELSGTTIVAPHVVATADVQTFLSVQNLGGNTSMVEINWYDDNGGIRSTSYQTLNSNEVMTDNIDMWIPGFTGTGTIKVRSYGPEIIGLLLARNQTGGRNSWTSMKLRIDTGAGGGVLEFPVIEPIPDQYITLGDEFKIVAKGTCSPQTALAFSVETFSPNYEYLDPSLIKFSASAYELPDPRPGLYAAEISWSVPLDTEEDPITPEDVNDPELIKKRFTGKTFVVKVSAIDTVTAMHSITSFRVYINRKPIITQVEIKSTVINGPATGTTTDTPTVLAGLKSRLMFEDNSIKYTQYRMSVWDPDGDPVTFRFARTYNPDTKKFEDASSRGWKISSDGVVSGYISDESGSCNVIIEDNRGGKNTIQFPGLYGTKDGIKVLLPKFRGAPQ